MSDSPTHPEILPGTYDPRVARVFRVIARRLICKHFHAVRLMPDSLRVLDSAADHDGPVVCCLTHAGWWDPMLGLLLHIERLKGRDGIAPIDKAVLEHVRIFRKLGLFGIDPDDPAAKDAVVDFMVDRLQSMDRPSLWITPQGRFQDPRDTLRIRPGVSAVLSRLTNPRALTLAIEYPFWDDKKPEMLVHITEIEPPARSSSTIAWHRSVSHSMRQTSGELACAAVSRNPHSFDTYMGGESGGTFFMYDWFLKLTGRETSAIRTRGVQP